MVEVGQVVTAYKITNIKIKSIKKTLVITSLWQPATNHSCLCLSIPSEHLRNKNKNNNNNDKQQNKQQ